MDENPIWQFFYDYRRLNRRNKAARFDRLRDENFGLGPVPPPPPAGMVEIPPHVRNLNGVPVPVSGHYRRKT